MMRTVLVTALLILTCAAHAAAQPAIFIVRHAERADAASGPRPSSGQGGTTMMADDPELSDAGRARAQALASLLKDAKIAAIFTTEFKRTQQTAAPLAEALAITPSTIPAKDSPGLMENLRSATGNVLVVGHSNTIPQIIKDLGVTTGVVLQDADYDNLFIVIMSARPQLIRLHYR
jgi:broad specificity phosphatase PhoE